MANMLFKTKGNAAPSGKPRVYFTCHPADFEKFFEKICGDIFATHQCAVYYTEDMTESVPQEEQATDLGSNNLFVVPVTFRLLTEPNRAMDSDIPYALQEHIPVLPVMMEPGLDALYAKPDKFGELQYLNPFSQDATEISYGEKLQKYLESVLISDEMAKRIRAAFDAYIFLSYRKKDRRYANELMRLIHKNPECRDIAIWYDEFLTPGESFKESIEKILADSKLFALLVTPNLLEEPEGKPNFVMGKEYPAAKESGVTILPAEMEATDKALLGEKFEDIPDCVDTHDEEAFRARLLESVEKIAIAENNNDPEHTFLIGLAYLEGIDVETDRERGLSLLTAAGEADLPEAMEKLYDMYYDGTGVTLDYRKAAHWAQRLADYYRETLGEEHELTLDAVGEVAHTYDSMGDFKKAVELHQRVYDLRCKLLGPNHKDTILTANDLASCHTKQGNRKEALELLEETYANACQVYGEEDEHTVVILNNLAFAHGQLGDPRKALELKAKAYEYFVKVSGEKNVTTISSLNNLAYSYGKMGEKKKALALKKQVYALYCEAMGEKHPYTISALNNLAVAYDETGDLPTALKLLKKAYTLGCEVLGEAHPNTLKSLNNIATTSTKLGNHKKALALHQKVLALRAQTLGSEHPDTIRSMNNVGSVYCAAGDYKKAAELVEEVYPLFRKVMGPEHWETVTVLNNMAFNYQQLGNFKKALALYEQVYPLYRKVFGAGEERTRHVQATIFFLRNILRGQ